MTQFGFEENEQRARPKATAANKDGFAEAYPSHVFRDGEGALTIEVETRRRGRINGIFCEVAL